ncbi:MAG: cation:proton antiporter [Candidatus Anstonellales archaeon]
MVDAVRVMFDLGAILVASFLGASIFEKLRLPPVIGMILAGILLSPFTPGFTVESSAEIKLFAELGGILLMFVLGLQFEYHLMRKLSFNAFILAGVASVATFLAGAFAATAIGMNFAEALIIGSFMVSTSTTMALKLQGDLNYKKMKNSKLMAAAIVIDDLYGFIVLGLISGYLGVKAGTFSDVLVSSFSMLLAIVAIFFIGVKVAPKVFEIFEKHFPSSSFTIGAAFCLMLVYTLTWFEVSPFISAFLAGTIITSSIRYKDVLDSVMPIRNLFASVFFVSIGLMLNPFLMLGAIPLVLFMTFVGVASKWVAASGVLIKLHSDREEAYKLGMLTAPRGEVLLIIAESVVAAGVVSEVFLSIATGIVLLSAFIPAILWRIDFLGAKVSQLSP